MNCVSSICNEFGIVGGGWASALLAVLAVLALFLLRLRPVGRPVPLRAQARQAKCGQQRRCAAPTATRLWNKAQGWTRGTTLGSGDGGSLNPNGVVAGGQRRRLVLRPPGRNPVGVEGPRGDHPGLAPRQPWALLHNPVGVGEGGFVLA